MPEHDEVAAALAHTVWPEIGASALCRDLTAAQLQTIYTQVAMSAIATVRQQVLAVVNGQPGVNSNGSAVIAPIVRSPDAEPDSG